MIIDYFRSFDLAQDLRLAPVYYFSGQVEWRFYIVRMPDPSTPLRSAQDDNGISDTRPFDPFGHPFPSITLRVNSLRSGLRLIQGYG